MRTQSPIPSTAIDPAAPSSSARPDFFEVPKRWRKFYRHWAGPGDVLAPNEVQCPVCKVVIRSHREFRPGDRVYCMPCMTRMVVVELPDGSLGTEVVYG